MIGGYTPGNPFDALIVGYYEGERLLYAAKVRNGFVPQVRREVASRFKGLEIDACPFAELVAQIEFTEWTPDGHLRHSFVGSREDKEGEERLCGRVLCRYHN